MSSYLKETRQGPLVVQDKNNRQYVVVDMDEYNRLSALFELYKEEDPEGAYKASFVREMKQILKNKNDIDRSVKSLKDL